MAGYNLGSAYVQVVPSMDGLKKGIEDPLGKAGDRAGRSFGGRIWSGVKKTAKVGALAAGAAAGVALVGGFRSAVQQDTGERVLAGLYGNAEKAATTLSGLRKVSSGSPINYQGYQEAAASLAYAGVEGEQAIGVLENVGKAITASGGDTSNMNRATDAVLRMVNAGKVQLDTLQQLSDAGVPILSGLAEHLGVPIEKVNEMASAGEIALEDVLAVMEDATGDTFQQMLSAGEEASKSFGNQWLIAKDNISTAIGGVLLPLLNNIAPAIGPISDAIVSGIELLPPIIDRVSEGFRGWMSSDGVQGFLGGLRDAFVGLYETALVPLWGFIKDNLLPIFAGLGAGALYGGIAAVVGAVGAAISAAGGLAGVVATAVGAIAWVPVAVGAAVAALVWFFKETEVGQNILSGFVSFVTDTLWPGIVGAFSAIRDFVVDELWPRLQGSFLAIRDLAVQVWQGVVQPALEQYVGFIRDTAFPIIQRLWTDYIQPVFAAIGGLAVWLWENAIKPAWDAMTHFVGSVLGPAIVWLWQSVISPAFSAIGSIISWVWDSVIFPALDGIKWLISNVVGPAIVWLWRNVVTPAFSAIGSIISWVWESVIQPAFNGLSWLVTNIVAPVVMWLWRNVIEPSFEGMKVAVQQAFEWIVNTGWPMLQGAWDALATMATWLYQNVIQPVWTGIRIAIAIAATAILAAMDLLIWAWESLVAPALRWLNENVVQPVWSAIRSAISAVVTWFRDTAWPILSAVIGWVTDRFNWLRDRLNAAWRFIHYNVINPVLLWFRNTAWPLFSAIVGWLTDRFNWLRDRLQAAWRFIRNNVINPVVTWFRDTVWPLFRRVIGQIRDRFVWFRDRLRDVWQYIKNTAIRPVVDWFADTVKPKIDDFTGKVRSAFDTLKDNVLKAWDAIKSGMKSPINGVIGIYNKHIAGNFNKVIDTLFSKDEAKKYRLAEMSTFATGGYTGPGSKYQPAGVVHADEYVIRKESQQSLRRDTPGFLDALNRFGSKALGYATGGWVKPFRGNYPINSQYRTARRPSHAGVDFPTPSGTPMIAVSDGTIVGASYHPAAGNKMSLQTNLPGIVAGYHHLSRYRAAHGSRVSKGDVIAYSGNTGRSTGPHLHFSIAKNGRYVNPNPYLQGTGTAGDAEDGGWWNPFTSLWGKIKDTVANTVGGGTVGALGSKVVEKTIGTVGDWVTGKLSSLTDWASGQVEGAVTGARNLAGAARWTPVATQALSMKGQMSQGNLSSLLRRMNQESSFNPRAINNWDVNARAGNSSRGLMQVIPTTFQAYKEPGYNDIWAPLDNILASINYTLSRYGSLQRGWNRAGGYADGGLVKPFLHDSGGWHKPGDLSLNQTRRPEAVLTNEQWATMYRLAEQNLAGSGGGGVTINGGVHGYSAGEVAAEIDKRRRRAEALYARV